MPTKRYRSTAPSAPSNLFDQVYYSSGIIEPGIVRFAGSLNAAGEIVGTATASAVVNSQQLCDVNPFQTVYGRFSTAFAAIGSYLNVSPAPDFTVVPAFLEFSQADGEESPAQFITVTTKSLSPAPYSMFTADGWLLPGPNGTSGQVSASSPAVLGLQVYGSPITYTGTYRSSVTVQVGTGTPVTIPVALNVTNTQSDVLFSMNSGAQFQDILSVPNSSGGADWLFSVNITEVAGIGTTLTGFKVGGVDYSSRITTLFGGTALMAGASVNALLTLSTADGIPTFPAVTQVELDGLDPVTGAAWSRTIQGVTFDGTLDADLILIGIPQVVRRNPFSATCPFQQHFVLQALGNSPVTLSFTQGLVLGTALYTPVAQILGSTYIPAGANLQTDTAGSVGTISTTRRRFCEHVS